MIFTENLVFKNGRIGGEITDFEVEDGKIINIGKTEKTGIDLGGLDVFPGLVDLHCHGCLGYDLVDAPEHFEDMCIFFAQNGTTSWYPTIGSGSNKKIIKALNTPVFGLKGANVMGIHMEGPYISSTYLGSGTGQDLRTPDINDFKDYPHIKRMTIAPELEGAIDFINNTDIVMTLGHTGADYETSIKAIEAGAKSLTHTFNAMPPLHHRNPGPVGAAIEKDINIEVICDGFHLHKSVILALYKIFGRKMMLVSDAVSSLGMPDGKYIIRGNLKRIKKDGVIRTEKGNLAGSASTLFMDVKKAIEFGIPREDAFYMASTSPSEHMEINKGKIKVGFDADFILVDKNNNLIKTFIGGKEI